jgi:D-alanyl-D-alanine carboxypeptidase
VRVADGPSAAAKGLAPLDKRTIQEALSAAVGMDVVGALLRVNGEDGAWEATAGSGEAGRERPIDPDGFFRIGSITKPIVAAVVLQLADEGRIDLDEPLQRRMPDLLPPSYPAITTRQLLGHTSGIPNYLPHLIDGPETLLRYRYRTWTPEELLAVAFEQQRAFEPGTSLGYSNTNYVLLGLLIREPTGRAWDEEVARRITGPLGMKSTFAPRDDPAVPLPHARGYTRTAAGLVDITELNPSFLDAAGSMISTARDLDLFLAALLAGELLTPDMLDQMLEPIPGAVEELPSFVGFGLGVQQVTMPSRCGERTVIGCGGGLWGYACMAFGTRDGRRRYVVGLNIAPADAMEEVDELSELTRTVFCGRLSAVSA